MSNRAISKELISEKRSLDEKLERLTDFLYTDQFHQLTEKHQSLLIKQAEYMGGYSSILAARIRDLQK